MPASRIFQATPFQVNTVIVLDKPASHHLMRVLRVNVGEKVTLFNGQGGEYHARIQHMDKHHVTAWVEAHIPHEVESPLRLHLAQGIARGEKMDYIIQKAVELGVHCITPLLTERCTVQLDATRREKRLAHWRSIIVSACEQCGRNQLPNIAEPEQLTAWLASVQTTMRFVLSPHVAETLPSHFPEAAKEALLLIGPEGGFSDAEMQRVYQYRFIPLNLGPRILRTETTSVAAIAVLQNRYGDM
ncbi:MAG: 16S rRNA (uracil(1498)-N(3))-methyltransferase [Gammaproteobacteria bacterium RIFCSPHIGHO2_12_FULL_41_20]|nr:MAG: 16S rRNA (uracil(1498)-N(3))-methyltransferase [Gammaproteobacteria bacterium RIFCSPHIGHO2_12_FULL_41_20]